ncbi:hypothetical protein MKX01_040643 [Papaver californicum]|nr:hypothetical protein MKX01_040643 [Papaver californicum]
MQARLKLRLLNGWKTRRHKTALMVKKNHQFLCEDLNHKEMPFRSLDNRYGERARGKRAGRASIGEIQF